MYLTLLRKRVPCLYMHLFISVILPQVDSTLQCMMNESSMDYVRKFADLAEQIAQGDPAPPHSKPDILNNQNNHTVKEIT